jgi:nucleotide-binding universal stress UspA family protein
MINVLLPTDFSDNALNAIHYAEKLFRNERCTFYLLNTYTPVIYSYDFQMNTGGYLGEVSDVIKTNSISELKKIKDKFLNVLHTVETISSFNILTDEIIEIVEENDIDLVIMGTKGATGAREVLFGSNTIHVIKRAKCPVLAIPDGYFFEKPSDILFPTDYKVDYTENQLNILKTIAAVYKSKLHVLHVSYSRDLNQEEINNKLKLERLLVDFNDTYHNVKDQEITEAINEFQKSTYVQLLMMINNKHSFFENLFFKPVISQIGFHLNVPFLVIPSKM